MEDKHKSAISKREEEILKFWQENKIFEKTLEKTKNKEPFVFYDGPPFATGTPHYGHILAGTMKDVIPRYQTMKGKFLSRKWGWDCHGLPIENLVQKELDVKTGKDIEKLGIDKFNEAAKASVFRFEKEWKKIVPRTGRFVDMENAYTTMDSTFTESVWWAFKTIYKKGLAYEGLKSVHISPELETVLSNFEVGQNYKDITDISVTAKFELADEKGTYLLAWTTTAWTLPGNVALAIGKDIEYVKVESDGLKYILAKKRLEKVFAGKKYELLEEVSASSLVGKSYKPLFDYYSKNRKLENHENGWKVYSADFVTTEDGTGIVHIAPAFGADDLLLGQKEKLPFVQHVNMDGTIKKEVVDFAGLQAKPKSTDEKPDAHQSTDIEVLKNLANRNLLFAKEKITHSYPHCWRTDCPLLNYATSSWFVKVTNIKDRMFELNEKINWVPKEIGKGRFGEWLKGARDWAISRLRYWGTAIPVWRSDDGLSQDVIGSLEELKKRTRGGNKYFVMRHGEAEHNIKRIISNKKDNPHHLTANGRREVEISAKELKNKNIDLIIVSPFVRTQETALIVKKELGLEDNQVIVDDRLSEVNFGAFNLKPISDYHNFYSSMEERFSKNMPEGENLTETKNRFGDFLYELDGKYDGKNVLIVTHEYGVWFLMAVAQGADLKETIKIKSEDDFVKTAEFRELDFAPIPHNEKYELDFHRPYIDDVTWINERGERMTRIKDVFDCWFESGSMPYAAYHYPFENKSEFSKWWGKSKIFPADFIAEGQDQTRGWFYTLLVLGTALFDKSPYKNVIVNGLVLAEDGKKMSKRLKNYPEVDYVLDKYGADAMRYYLLSSPAMHAEDLAFSEKGLDEIVKKVIMRLSNVVSFFELYAKDKINISSQSKNILDRWILIRLKELTNEVTEKFDSYELDRATRPLLDFVEDLSIWYLRRSRDRFKEESEDKDFALQTLRNVLSELAKVIAPTMPFLAEDIYKKIKGEKESVHLEDWPKAKKINESEKEIIKEMSEVRKVVSFALEQRSEAKIKVRQPLSLLKIKSEILNSKHEYNYLIKDEVNVKEVLYDMTMTNNVLLSLELTPELIEEGIVRDLIRIIQDKRKEMKLIPGEMARAVFDANEKMKNIIKENETAIKEATHLKSVEFKKLNYNFETTPWGVMWGDEMTGIEISK